MKTLSFIIILATLFTSCIRNVETKNVTPDIGVTGNNSSGDVVEGTINGGGGKGVLCLTGGQEKLETLDLYEGRIIYNLNIPENLNSEDEAFDFLAEKLANHFWNPYSIEINEMKKSFREVLLKNIYTQIRFLDEKKSLKLVPDSAEVIVEDDCKMVQVAVYYNESALMVDQKLWNKMNWTNKAALIMHEMFYLMDRKAGAKNSVHSRKAVARIFSTEGLKGTTEGVDPDNFASCRITKNGFISYGNFLAYDTERFDLMMGRKYKGLELVFTFLNYKISYLRTSIFMRDLNMSHILQGPHISAESVLEIDAMNDTTLNMSGIKVYMTSDATELNRGKISFYNEKTDELVEDLDYSCTKYQNSATQPIEHP